MPWERVAEGHWVQTGTPEVTRVVRALQADDVAAIGDQSENRFTVRPSTDHRNRGGDIVMTRGCITKNYAANPVIFWGHNSYGFPIGQTTKLSKILSGADVTKVGAAHLLADAWLAGEEEGHGEAQLCANLVRKRFVRTASYGANFYEWKDLGEDEPEGPSPASPLMKEWLGQGRRVTKWELLEWSFVGIPKNVKADVVARAGLDMASVADDWTSDRVADEAREFLSGAAFDRFMNGVIIESDICLDGVCLSKAELEKRLAGAVLDEWDPDEDAGFDHTEEIFGQPTEQAGDEPNESDETPSDEAADDPEQRDDGAAAEGAPPAPAAVEGPDEAAATTCGCGAGASAGAAPELAALRSSLEATTALAHQLAAEMQRDRAAREEESTDEPPAWLAAFAEQQDAKRDAALAALAGRLEDATLVLWELKEREVEAAKLESRIAAARAELARVEQAAVAAHEKAAAARVPAAPAPTNGATPLTFNDVAAALRLAVDEINGVVR